MKLLQKDLEQYRRNQYKKQEGICPICNVYIEWEEAVLDHDHVDGYCRNVLHRNCNTCEGKIKNAFTRYVSKKGIYLSQFMINLAHYLNKDYSDNPIHPTEKSPQERRLQNINKHLKKIRKAKGTRPSTLEKYETEAKELRKIIKEERTINSWKPSADE